MVQIVSFINIIPHMNSGECCSQVLHSILFTILSNDIDMSLVETMTHHFVFLFITLVLQHGVTLILMTA